MLNVHLDSLRTDWKVKKYPNLSEHETWNKLKNQGTVLIDTTGFTFNMCFPYNNDNYLIFSEEKHTYLGLLTTGSLSTLNTLLNFPTWKYDELVNEKINGYYHYNFNQQSAYSDNKIIRKNVSTGDIYAKGDSIVIAYKRNETKKNVFAKCLSKNSLLLIHTQL